MKQKTPRILLLDIETTPILGYSYGIYDTNIIHIVEDWYIYAWSAKWYGEKEVFFEGVYKSKSDKKIVQKLHKLMSEADIFVAHNGDKFDLPKINTRFAFHKLPPIAPKPTIDTLKVVKRVFRLSSNSLDYVCRYFGLERKKPSDQKDWLLKMKAGDPHVWKKIKVYSVQDTLILEPVYNKLLSWIPNHPNVSVLKEVLDGCPKCGSKRLMRQGTRLTQTGKVQQYQCQDCKGWSSGKAQKLTNIK